MSAANLGVKRIREDIRELRRHPSNRYFAEPLEEDMFEWHFTIRGPKDTPFEHGVYHGRILLPAQYPYEPPNIVFLTKNGRFEVGTKICLSISAHHPEAWQPAWGIRTMLEALISFLPTPGTGAIGALEWTAEERENLAEASHGYTCRHCGVIGDLVDEHMSKNGEEDDDEELASRVADMNIGSETPSSPATPVQPATPNSGLSVSTESGSASVTTPSQCAPTSSPPSSAPAASPAAAMNTNTTATTDTDTMDVQRFAAPYLPPSSGRASTVRQPQGGEDRADGEDAASRRRAAGRVLAALAEPTPFPQVMPDDEPIDRVLVALFYFVLSLIGLFIIRRINLGNMTIDPITGRRMYEYMPSSPNANRDL